MAGKVQAKKKTASKSKAPSKFAANPRVPSSAVENKEPRSLQPGASGKDKEPVKSKEERERRREALYRMLMDKRQEIMKEIEGNLGQSLTEDQQRRLESARDVGDQALMDLERELGISLMEMRNRKRQLIDEALTRLAEGTYGVCAECGVEISEKRLAAVPFAKLCVECQSKQELLEKIEKEEERE
jgi:DnaK suppressor protein